MGAIGQRGNFGFRGHVREALRVISIEARGLFAVAGHNQVELAIAIEVAEIRGHVAEDFPVGSQTGARDKSDFFKCAVALVVIEEILAIVVGDEEVGPTIVVVIAPNNAHTMKLVGIVDARFFRHILEGAVATIAEQIISFTRHFVGHLDDDGPVAGSVGVGRRQVVEIGVNVASYKQVEISISIVVSPSRTGAEPTDFEARPFRSRPRICSRPRLWYSTLWP